MTIEVPAGAATSKLGATSPTHTEHHQALSDAIVALQSDYTVCTASTRPGSPADGDLIYETDTDRVLVYNGTDWVEVHRQGAWTAHTPQIDQGASTNIAKTVNYSNYIQIGKTVHWGFSLKATGTGTGGSAITITLPVAAHAGSGGNYMAAGLIVMADAGAGAAGVYVGAAKFASTTQLAQQVTGSANFTGANPNYAVAVDDTIDGTVTYEAA